METILYVYHLFFITNNFHIVNNLSKIKDQLKDEISDCIEKAEKIKDETKNGILLLLVLLCLVLFLIHIFTTHFTFYI